MVRDQHLQLEYIPGQINSHHEYRHARPERERYQPGQARGLYSMRPGQMAGLDAQLLARNHY